MRASALQADRKHLDRDRRQDKNWASGNFTLQGEIWHFILEQHCHLLSFIGHCLTKSYNKSLLFILCVPHLPVESADGVVGEEPVVGPELGQLDPAEVATVSRQQRRHWQQGVRQLEEVPITAPEFLPVDLRGVPLEGGGGHVRTRFKDSAPSGGMEKSGILKIGIRESCQLLTGGNFRHSHLTFTADKEAESKALGRLSQVAQASGVLSAGIGQGAQEVVCQVAAAFPQGGALGFRQHLAQWTEGQREREKGCGENFLGTCLCFSLAFKWKQCSSAALFPLALLFFF